MTKYNLYLDDFRDPQASFNYLKDSDYLKLNWVIVRSYDEFIKIVTSKFNNKEFIELVSFDHDLNDEHYAQLKEIDYSLYKEKTGYECALWLIDFCMEHDLWLPKFKVHSQNTVGAENINMLLSNFRKFQGKNM